MKFFNLLIAVYIFLIFAYVSYAKENVELNKVPGEVLFHAEKQIQKANLKSCSLRVKDDLEDIQKSLNQVFESSDSLYERCMASNVVMEVLLLLEYSKGKISDIYNDFENIVSVSETSSSPLLTCSYIGTGAVYGLYTQVNLISNNNTFIEDECFEEACEERFEVYKKKVKEAKASVSDIISTVEAWNYYDLDDMDTTCVATRNNIAQGEYYEIHCGHAYQVETQTECIMKILPNGEILEKNEYCL